MRFYFQNYYYMEQKVYKVLQIHNHQKIGTSAIQEILYKSDVDLQEFIYTKETYEEILKRFQKKFQIAKDTDGMWITDFKCGVLPGSYPIRWTYDTIMQGFQYLNGQLKYFTTCLQQQSIIKMDLFALVDGKFVEFSENYYFIFPDEFSTQVFKGDDISAYLLIDYDKYVKAGRRFKALKRLFSHYKHKNDKEKMDILIDFFNSPVGKFNQQINSLKIIIEVMDNNFKPVRLSDIKHNIKIVQEIVPDNYKRKLDHIINYSSRDAIRTSLEKVIKQMEMQVDLKTRDFMLSVKLPLN